MTTNSCGAGAPPKHGIQPIPEHGIHPFCSVAQRQVLICDHTGLEIAPRDSLTFYSDLPYTSTSPLIQSLGPYFPLQTTLDVVPYSSPRLQSGLFLSKQLWVWSLLLARGLTAPDCFFLPSSRFSDSFSF